MIEQIDKIIEKYKINKTEDLGTIKADFLAINTAKYYLNNGEVIIRDSIIKPNPRAAMIIPETIDGKYLMVIQPRVATKRGVTVEFPAGLVDNDENVNTALKRELKEETGYEAEEIEFIMEYYQDTATSNASLALARAKGCKKTSEQHLDADEFITFVELTYEEILELIKQKYIVDANTIMGVLNIKK